MIQLKPWSDHSIETLNELYEHVNQKYCLTQLPVPLEQEPTERYLKAAETGFVDEKPFLCFAILLDEVLIGKTDLSCYEGGFAEVDIVIREEYTGNGYGREALEQLVEYVTSASWCTAIGGYVEKDNMHARRMFMKAGFRQTRPFSADIMTPVNGKYVLKTKQGYEYIRYI